MVAGAMRWMLEHADEYRQMRVAAWSKARELHSKREFEHRLQAFVRESFAAERVAT
jgi:hypothetical protein